MSTMNLPPIARLSLERQWYLYNSIRQYRTPETRDITCPLPSVSAPVPLPSALVPPPPSEEPTAPQAKRRRQCGRCNQPGHNRATCTNTELPCEYKHQTVYSIIMSSTLYSCVGNLQLLKEDHYYYTTQPYLFNPS